MTWRICDARQSPRWHLLLAASVFTIALVAALLRPPVMRAQTAAAASAKSAGMPEWQKAAGGKMEFDVASVKQSAPGTNQRRIEYMSPLDGPPLKGGLFSANAPLITYVMFAYKVDLTDFESLVKHLPTWAMVDLYDIEARAEGNPTKDQVRLMMQSLLEDRFKLAHHTEVREAPVYALATDKADKLGPQLQPHPANSPCVEKPLDAVQSARGVTPPPYCGMDGWMTNGLLHLRFIDVTMDQAAAMLGAAAGFAGGRDIRPIVDRTGLAGKYDINIEFVKDQGSPDAESEGSGSTFTAALKKQLGLKLQPETGPAATFVVDRVERPSED